MSEAQSTVIVVDDDPEIREALDGLLRSVGLQVQMLASVPEFLKSAPPDCPTCLILDVRLPGRKAVLIFSENLRRPTFGSRSSSSRYTATSRCRCRQ